jgi:hypothetical protein
MNEKFIPTSDAASLSRQCVAVMRAASDLMETISSELPANKQQVMMQVIEGGGCVGLEITVDAHAENQVSLVAIEREGRRITIATVATIGQEKSGVVQ